jgi:hypothetical protein
MNKEILSPISGKRLDLTFLYVHVEIFRAAFQYLILHKHLIEFINIDSVFATIPSSVKFICLIKCYH